jgi:multiple antibiotic resistance protein
MDWFTHLSLLLLGISSVLPLINPVGTAIIMDPYFSGQTTRQRQANAAKIVIYCFALGIGTLLLGSWCLRFMGISVSSTQLAGGVLISRMGIGLLSKDPDKADAQGAGRDISKSLFYPLAFPLTVGPGCVSVLITLSAHAHGADLSETLWRMLVLSFSYLIACALTFCCLAYSHFVTSRIGESGSMILNRLSAYLLFCIGVQMAVNGLRNTFPQLLLHG